MIKIVGYFFEYIVFFYGFALLITYGVLAFLSLAGIRRYHEKNKFTDYNDILASPLAPGISVIASAYNESLTIISNVRSLLTMNYSKFEVVIVNDGSTDDTLEKLISAFKMVEVDFAYNARVSSQPVKRFFKSTDMAYDKLLVVDKVNGKSKADGVNAGINASSFNYFLCTDVDCILESNTLLKMIKPFMEEESSRKRGRHHICTNCGHKSNPRDPVKVIAVGATLRMTNSSEIDEGVMKRFRPPTRWLPRFQEMEYIRAFVLGKMGWSQINCVPNVSGGLGLFDKEIAIKAGGYDSLSFAEDMDLVIRMSLYMINNNLKYAVRYIPTTQCWTEGPPNLKIFSRQRTRWGRGLSQIIGSHGNIMFRPSYGRLSMIVLPYSFLFEFLAPVIEASGILYYLYLIVMGSVNWQYAVILLVFAYLYSVMITTIAVLWDQLTLRYYKTWREVLGLCFMAFFEPFGYHPLIVFFAMRGYFNSILKKESEWGKMQRQGFEGKVQHAAIAESV